MACLYKLLIVKNKNDFKTFARCFITRILSGLIPVLILFMYLVFNGAIDSFIDYTINGISTFSNYISYINLLHYGIESKILSILMPINFILMFVVSVIITPKKDWQNYIYILFAYSIATFIVTFPISDKVHFYIGITPSIISLIYIISLVLHYIRKKITIKIFNNKFIKVVFSVIFSFILFFSIIKLSKNNLKNLYFYLNEKNKYTNFDNYKYIKVGNDLQNEIKEIDSYILENEAEGKKVYILDAAAAVYMIPLNKYNKNYDMFNKGNFGKNGEDGIIEDISNEANALYLIKKDNYQRNWQNPEKVREYIKKDLKKIDEIFIFDVYTIDVEGENI